MTAPARVSLRDELARILREANTGRITPEAGDPTRYSAMAEAALERLVATARDDWGFLFPGDRDDMSQLIGNGKEECARMWQRHNPTGQVFRRTITYSPWKEDTDA